MKFYILDVFGTERYSGNQLACFLDHGRLSSVEMQQIAREMNFSETTFITGNKSVENTYPVRIFTPVNEIEFAGHPSLGTAYVILKSMEQEATDKITLDLAVGQIPITVEDDTFWMQQNQPKFGNIIPVPVIAGMLGIDDSDIDQEFPVLETTTGLPFTIVPLRNITALKKAQVSLKQYSAFIQSTWAKGILVFSPEAYDYEQQLSARVFVNYLGIPEDPATGSAAGCLAAYLLETGYFGKEQIELNIGQGYEIGRPSLLKIKAKRENKRYDIKVGGKVTKIANGEWRITAG